MKVKSVSANKGNITKEDDSQPHSVMVRINVNWYKDGFVTRPYD